MRYVLSYLRDILVIFLALVLGAFCFTTWWLGTMIGAALLWLGTHIFSPIERRKP